MIIALYLGKWLDNRYQTEPWLFLASMGVAFMVSSVGIVVITLKYIKEIEEEAQAKKEALNKPQTVINEQSDFQQSDLNNKEELNKEEKIEI